MRKGILGLLVVASGVALHSSVGRADCSGCRGAVSNACDRTAGCSYEVKSDGWLYGSDNGKNFACSPTTNNCGWAPSKTNLGKTRGDALGGILKNAPIRTGGGTIPTHPSTGPNVPPTTARESGAPSGGGKH
jgi:hypothetical protein